jgi:predicted dienelactone hydrolase
MIYKLFFLFTALVLFSSLQAQSPYKVGQQTLEFDDQVRKRKLITEVWYPTLDQTQPQEIAQIPFNRMATLRNAPLLKRNLPLILFSHGTGGGRLTVEWFCAGLASHGFIVAAVDHVGNTFNNPIPIEFLKFWERPLDIKFILNQLLLENNFSESIDTSRIAAAGFSLGGYTAISLAGATMNFDAFDNFFKSSDGAAEGNISEMPGLLDFYNRPGMRDSLKLMFQNAGSLYDHRIKSAFVMAPAIGQVFKGKSSTKNITIPIRIVAAESDKVTPVNTNAQHYVTLLPDAQLTLLGKEAGHYVFLNDAKESLKKEAPLYFTDHPAVSRKEIHEKTLQLAIDFFIKTLKL